MSHSHLAYSKLSVQFPESAQRDPLTPTVASHWETLHWYSLHWQVYITAQGV